MTQRQGDWPKRAEFIANSFPNHMRADIDPARASFLDGSVLNMSDIEKDPHTTSGGGDMHRARGVHGTVLLVIVPGAVAVLEVDAQVLDRLGLELGEDPSVDLGDEAQIAGAGRTGTGRRAGWCCGGAGRPCKPWSKGRGPCGTARGA